METSLERLLSDLSLSRVRNQPNDALEELSSLLRADAKSLEEGKESIEVSIMFLMECSEGVLIDSE